MSKKFLLVFLLIVCAFTFRNVIKPVEVQDPITLSDNISRWSYQDDGEKFELIMQMFNLSDGAASMNIIDRDSLLQEGARHILDISDCVDSSGITYYIQYRGDVEIGSVIINCFSRLGMLSN
jgi:hypothetical protein